MTKLNSKKEKENIISKEKKSIFYIVFRLIVSVTSSTSTIANIMGAFDGDRATKVATDPSETVYMYFQVV